MRETGPDKQGLIYFSVILNDVKNLNSLIIRDSLLRSE
jgi:hypothetical protein